MPLLQVAELVNMAVKDEIVGEAFYKALAGRSENDKIREKLLEIAEQEKHHAARFSEIARGLKAVKTHEQYPDQYESFVNALLANRAFPSADEAVKKAGSVNISDGLDIAIRMEKDTILFYQEMIAFLPKTDSGAINEIMNEERNHLTSLAELKAI